jgi:predicted Zn-dependent peptidase
LMNSGKVLRAVTPAQAGGQDGFKWMNSGFRRNDEINGLPIFYAAVNLIRLRMPVLGNRMGCEADQKLGGKMKSARFQKCPLLPLIFFILAAGFGYGAAWGEPLVTSLPNGLKVFILENPGTSSVTVDLWVRAGSRYESASLNGISHFAEHLLFKGTARRSAEEISREIASVGGFINAYTHWEYTQVHLSLLPDRLETGLDVLADMTRNSLMSAEMVEKERKVLLEEISLANIYPPSYILNLVSRTLFGENPLALPISGTKDSVKAIRKDDLLHFYRLHYAPDRIFLTIVGNINPSKTLEAVRAHFSSWTAKSEPLPPASPPLRQSRFQEVGERKFLDQAIVVLALQAMGRHDLDRPAFEVINAVLGSGGHSRLYQEIREKKALSYLVGSLYHPLADTGLWATYAGTNPKNIDTVRNIMLQQIRRIQEEPLSAKELADIKNYIRGRILIQTENNSRLSDFIGVGFVSGPWELPRDFLSRLEAVTAADILRVARAYLREDQANLIVLKPYPGLMFFRNFL